MIGKSAVTLLLLVAIGCGGDPDGEPEDLDLAIGSDTVETEPVPETVENPPAAADSVPAEVDPDPAAVAGNDTTDTAAADSAADAEPLPVPTGTAPAPPGGYAIETRPSEAGKLSLIEYASPKTVADVARFYDSQYRFPGRIVLDLMGDDMVAYGLTPNTTVGPATTPQDIERLLEQRSEPILVVTPWTMQRDNPLIGDLREAGQDAQADALLQTKSKVIVVSRPPERRTEEPSS